MKQYLLLLLTAASMATSAIAQIDGYEEMIVPQQKHSVSTNGFWHNWFVSAGGTYAATYSSQEAVGVPTSPFLRERTNYGGMVAIGKWVAPSFGVRLKVEGIERKVLINRTIYHDLEQWNAHFDALFNLSNLLVGYNPKRVWNFVPYVGFGVARNMSDNVYGASYNVGLLNNIRLGQRVNFFVDFYAHAVAAKFDGLAAGSHSFWASRHWDKQLGAAVGLTFNLGKTTWERTPDLDALIAMNREQINALNASLEAQQNENARLRALLQQKATTTDTPAENKSVPVVIDTPAFASVFFAVNRSNISSKKDLVDVKVLADFAIANGKRLLVTGYADSATGSASYNQALSEKRAKVVADILVNMGVSRDSIVVVAKGGATELSPISYNRRATVEIK